MSREVSVEADKVFSCLFSASRLGRTGLVVGFSWVGRGRSWMPSAVSIITRRDSKSDTVDSAWWSGRSGPGKSASCDWVCLPSALLEGACSFAARLRARRLAALSLLVAVDVSMPSKTVLS